MQSAEAHLEVLFAKSLLLLTNGCSLEGALVGENTRFDKQLGCLDEGRTIISGLDECIAKIM